MALKIESVAVGKINPAPYNPRKDLQPGDPDYEALKRSLEKWDVVEPLVWNKRSGHLVGGHQRFKVLVERGDKKIDVSVVDLSSYDEQALNIALNKISGDWDSLKLADVLDGLKVNDFDATLTGFSPSELKVMLGGKENTTEEQPGWETEWGGMPEFSQEDQTPFKSVIVHLKSMEDVEAFAGLIQQGITDKTKSLWYPRAEVDKVTDRRWLAAEAGPTHKTTHK